MKFSFVQAGLLRPRGRPSNELLTFIHVRLAPSICLQSKWYLKIIAAKNIEFFQAVPLLQGTR